MSFLCPPLRLPLRRLAAAALGLGLAVAPVSLAHAAARHAKIGAPHAYQTLAEAKTGCGSDTVVWRAHDSKVFHLSSSRYFGKTKHGSYVCEKAAEGKGLHAAKS